MAWSQRDTYAGLLLTVVGLFVAYKGSHYEIGGLTDMGPGFFPAALGALLAVMGVAIALAARSNEAEAAQAFRVEWRGLELHRRGRGRVYCSRPVCGFCGGGFRDRLHRGDGGPAGDLEDLRGARLRADGFRRAGIFAGTAGRDADLSRPQWMIETSLAGLAHGFAVAFEPHNLIWCLAGVIGNVVGVLPGMGVMATVSILLPLTFAMNPVGPC